MSDKLKALLESQVLSDENKAQLQEAFDAAVDASVEQVLESERKQIISAAVNLIEETVQEELSAIKEEIKHARTLEVQYAEKLEAFKESYAAKQDEALPIQIQEAVAAEMEGIMEDIEMAKKHQFAMKLVESFASVYEQMNLGEGKEDITARLAEAESKLEAYARKEKLEECLAGLTGKKRALAETILEGVATDKIEARFESIRDAILGQKVEDEAVVTESATADSKEEPVGTVVMENVEPVEEGVQEAQPKVNDQAYQRILKSLGRV